MRSKLLWSLLVLIGMCILSMYYLPKVKEGFAGKNRKNRKNTKNRKITKITKNKNALKMKDNNVVIPKDASIEFGGGVSDKEVNAGKIRYGGWDGGALNIVGAGGNGVHRNVRVWDRLQVGSLDVQEDGCIGYGTGKQYKFCFQTDGNVVQYKDKKPVWATGIPS